MIMTSTIMRQEALEVPDLISRQLNENKALCQTLAKTLRSLNPSFIVTVGRGTSDHAGVFAKYLIEIELGIQVSSSAPSVSSIYHKKINLENAVVIFISQSGRSPDILDQVKMAKSSGAYCIALINDETSPIVDLVDTVIPLKAGEEKAVAATKSYLLTLSALLQLVSYWGGNIKLESALNTLPSLMNMVVNSPQQLKEKDFLSMKHCVVLGRGFGYATALEIALKLKEVCGIHAEAFSSAEFLHGPVTLAEQKLSIINIPIKDESYSSHKELIDNIAARGAELISMQQINEKIHPRIAALTFLQRFYLDVEKIAISRGVNPDTPPGLKKVTKTI